MSEKIKIHKSVNGGSAKWVAQRISAIALIPLFMWLILSILLVIKNPAANLPAYFSHPFNVIAVIIFIFAALYHSTIGICEVLEDYVSCKAKRHFYMILVKFISAISGVAAFLAVFKLHFLL